MRTTTVSGCSSRAALRISIPSVSGSFRSVSTRSNGPARSFSRAASPVPTPSISNPSPRRSLVRKCTMFSSSSTTRSRAGASLMASAFGGDRDRRGGREHDSERGAAARRQLHHQRPVEQLDDAVADRQPESRPLSPPLRREERLEDPPEAFAWNPGPAVPNRDRHGPLSRLEYVPDGMIALPRFRSVPHSGGHRD